MLLTTKTSLQLIHEFSNYKLNCIVCDFCDPSPQIELLICLEVSPTSTTTAAHFRKRCSSRCGVIAFSKSIVPLPYRRESTHARAPERGTSMNKGSIFVLALV